MQGQFGGVCTHWFINEIISHFNKQFSHSEMVISIALITWVSLLTRYKLTHGNWNILRRCLNIILYEMKNSLLKRFREVLVFIDSITFATAVEYDGLSFEGRLRLIPHGNRDRQQKNNFFTFIFQFSMQNKKLKTNNRSITISKFYDLSRIGFIWYVILQRNGNVSLFIVYLFEYIETRDRSLRFLAYTKIHHRNYRA